MCNKKIYSNLIFLKIGSLTLQAGRVLSICTLFTVISYFGVEKEQNFHGWIKKAEVVVVMGRGTRELSL